MTTKEKRKGKQGTPADLTPLTPCVFPQGSVYVPEGTQCDLDGSRQCRNPRIVCLIRQPFFIIDSTPGLLNSLTNPALDLANTADQLLTGMNWSPDSTKKRPIIYFDFNKRRVREGLTSRGVAARHLTEALAKFRESNPAKWR